MVTDNQGNVLSLEIGDTVQVRGSEELYTKYGVDKDGFIVCGNETFLPQMTSFCGLTANVTKVYTSKKGKPFRIVRLEGDMTLPWSAYKFSYEMLKEVDEKVKE